MQNGKDTVYIDIDDDITTIIEKVTGSKQKVVALVLPKRAAVLQSMVNMKLLKRSADNASKNVVLVTSEAGLMPLAGTVGLHVAKTPLSKPEIPVSPVIRNGVETIDEDEVVQMDDQPVPEYTAENAGDMPVGELAGAAAGVGAAATKGVETVELDDEAEAIPADHKDRPKKKSNGKQSKIPSFMKFQKGMIFAALGLIVLIVGLYFCIAVLPKATVAISTDATDYNSDINVTLDSTASGVSVSTNTVPATIVQQQKTYTQQVAATGQLNNGDKATGSIQMEICANSPGVVKDVPAGTVVTTSSQTYLTQDTAHFTYNPGGGGSCFDFRSNDIDITATKSGANYNTDHSATFTVNGRNGVSATGSASGGTDDITKVVSQSDIDNAKSQINTQDTTAIKSALLQQLRQQNLYPVQSSFAAGTPSVTSSSQPGDKADTVTLTESITYTMYGTQRSYLDQLIKNNIKQQIDPATQTILKDGLDNATVKQLGVADTSVKISVSTTATVGPKLSVSQLKDQIRGKKAGYVKSLIGNQPGVTKVSVKLSPFWVSSVPSNLHKITITVDKASDGNSGS